MIPRFIYFRACAEEVCVFSHEISRFASEIKKVHLTSDIEKAKPIRMQKNNKTADDAINK